MPVRCEHPEHLGRPAHRDRASMAVRGESDRGKSAVREPATTGERAYPDAAPTDSDFPAAWAAIAQAVRRDQGVAALPAAPPAARLADVIAGCLA